MTAVRAIIADFGGVLYRTPSPAGLKRILRLLGLREPGVLSMLHSSPLESQEVMDIWTGVIAEQHLWDEIALKMRAGPRLMRVLRGSSYAPWNLQRRLVRYLNGLRPRYQTAILTNAGTDFRATFSRAFRLETIVDHVIISAEEGIAKPDPAIYFLAASQLGVQPKEIVFFDDMPENVEGARQAGMQAFHHLSARQTMETLDALLN